MLMIAIRPALYVPRGYSYRVGNRVFACVFSIGKLILVGKPMGNLGG